MDVHYCRGWFRARHVMSEPLSEVEARSAYDSRTLHTAVIGDAIHPRAFVECNMDYIGVEFLDRLRREYVTYQFQERNPGTMFLSMAVFREFIGDENKVAHAVAYYYQEDGNCIVHKVDKTANLMQEANVKLDLRANWEPYPKFGEYESISRLERGLDLIH